MTFASGKKMSARGITYYRLADGRIVEDVPMTPDLMQELGAMMQAPQEEDRRPGDAVRAVRRLAFSSG